MGIFHKTPEEKAEINKDPEAYIWKRKIDKYIQENHLEDLYHDENIKPMNRIAISSAAKGSIPQFQDQGTKTIYSQQLVLEQQNWMLIRQNNEIIELLKKQSKN